MKKAVSLLASFALAFSLFGAPVISFADEGENASADQETIVQAGDIALLADERDASMLDYLEGLDDNEFTDAQAPTTGSVEVRLTTLLVDPSRTGGLKATLSGPSSKSVDFVAKSATELSENGYVAKLDSVTPGTYSLVVEGPGFLPYSQSGVRVEAGKRAVVMLLDQYSDVLCGETSHKQKGEQVLVDVCAGYGLIPYGNLDNDRGIDNADARVLLQAIARARAGATLSAEETARFGMNLMRDIITESDTGEIEATRPVETPADDEVTLSSLSVEEPESLSNGNAADPYTEVQLTYNAGGEDPAKAASMQPEFRIANASEDVDAGEADVTTAPLADEPDDENELIVNEALAGTVGRVKHTEPIGVGLNAFQKLATMRNARTTTAKVNQVSETSHMQVVASEDTDVVIDSGKSLTDVLFNDNGDVVKMYPASDAPISETNPVELTINAQGTPTDAITIAIPNDSPNAPTAGQIIVQDADNPDSLITCDFLAAAAGGRISSVVDMRSNAFAAATARATYGADTTPVATVNPASGVITVDLKGQIPVKTITIRVTSTSSKKLAEIAQVEFLNGFEKKIPEPDLNIPVLKQPATVGSKSITVAWDGERNVTGYEVEISYNGATSVVSTVKNSATIKNIAGKELVNYRTYTLRARSANGEWRSPWSAPITATPEASGKPKSPAAPRIVGGYDSITVSWSAVEDAEWHNLYYRKQAKSGEQAAAWIKVDEAKDALKYTITVPGGLELDTYYEAYIEGVNRHGTGPASKVVSAKTTPNKVKVPWYSLLNKEVINNEKGLDSFESVIEKVEIDYNKGGDPKNMVDGNYDTYITGAKGGYHHGGTVTFKEAQDGIDTIVLTGYQGQSLNIYDLIVQAWDENNQPIKPSGGNIKKSVLNYSSNTRTVMIRTEKLEGVKKIRVAYQRAVGNQWSAATIAELAFYSSTLYSDVMDVWADDEHTQLKDGITEDRLVSLKDDVNTPENIVTKNGTVSEYHPSKSVLLAELDNALIVCRNGSLRAPIKVDGNLNIVGAKRGVGGLNGWQPLGVAAAAGDEISVYVGRKGETNGAVPLAIYIVQNHPDISNGFAVRLDSSANKVQVGLNTYRIPENITTINMERGGSLYVEYGTSRGNNEQYTVRVSGGSDIPLLDIHNVTNAETRMNLIRKYVESLKEYDPDAVHKAKGHVTPPSDTEYHSGDCIANATDIVLKDMMYSVPASTVAANIGVDAESTADEVEAAAQKLSTSLSAMDDMMTLFYQHKGFVKNTSQAAAAGFGSNNAWPTLHQNIRYVQCSGSTFMYAAGNHIGVQGSSVGGLVSMSGVTTDGNGKYQSGKFFGWGVAHEIGHEINNGAYTYAEVTNNFYAQLAQATDMPGNYKTRWGSYDGIYKRVSSGAKGMAMGKTGIAMYWQLHLAYDDGYNFKTYDNAADQFNNMIFARMDAYGRNVNAAPNKGHALTMAGANKDNAIMRLACAATQKDLLDFFKAWGLTPDAETIAYAEQWPKETRAIQYQTDALRLYRLGDLGSRHSGNAAEGVSVAASLDYTPIEGRAKTTSDQTIKVHLTASTDDAILGYEVLRNEQVVGFLRANEFEDCQSAFVNGSATFNDTINTVNNRVFEYQVRAVDKLLNRGELIDVDTVKVSHQNVLDKTNWTATTNMASGSAMPNETHSVSATVNGDAVVFDQEGHFGDDDELYDTPATPAHPIVNAIDGDMSTVFSGAIPTDKDGNVRENDARITIDFGEKVEAVGFRVKDASVSSGFVAQTSSDGVTWNTIPTMVSETDGIIYFSRESDKYLHAQEIGYLRLTLPGQTSFSVAEIDVVGPQGDDVEFLESGSIGILSQDEVLGTTASEETRTIPAGSLVFLGTYKGNPAFNAVLLYDQKGKILGGVSKDGAVHSEEVIFAPEVAANAKMGDVSEGFWAYYILPEYLTDEWLGSLTSVKAELYRVDNASTLEGQRLVADTLSVEMPEDLSKIDLTFGEVKQPESSEEGAEQQSIVEGGFETQQLAGAPIENAAVSGYTYDFADMFGNEPNADAVQGGAAGTPIYGSPIVDQGALGGTPIYGGAGGPILGTPIYDDATPLASPHHKSNVLAKTAVRSVSETFIVAIEDTDVINVAKSLG